MLNVENLSCGYGKEPVVRRLSFALAPGERLAVLGPNGCGKTTLLRGLMGILPSAGLMELGGKSIRAMSVRERSRFLSMFTQMNAASFSYTVMETALMGRYAHTNTRLFAAPDAKDRQIAEEQLKKLKLWQDRDRPVTELSGGQFQRVMLARAFVQTPKVILLDEPANHLDLKYQVELVEELKRWTKESGRMAVGVFHDLDLAFSFADRILLMEQGECVYFGNPWEMEPARLNRVYGMDVKAYMLASRDRWERWGREDEHVQKSL